MGADHPERAGLVMLHTDTEAMNLHLAEIGKTVAPGAHAALVLDGAGWHGSDKLVVPDNITLVKLPPYALELNPIENVWAYLRGTKLAHRLFSGYDDIVDACCDAWNSFIADTKTVRSITTRQWAVCQNSDGWYETLGELVQPDRVSTDISGRKPTMPIAAWLCGRSLHREAKSLPIDRDGFRQRSTEGTARARIAREDGLG